MIIEIEQGQLEGTGGPIDRFLGIPYAAPPIGVRRWRPPEAASRWPGIRRAHQFGPDCPQSPMMESRAPNQSEDCLYLNVWAPHARGTEPLPVLLWVPGGAFVGGSGADLRTDGTELAGHGLVVVTLNYRTGLLGFLAHPDLAAEGEGTSGNYGLLDLVAALKWVGRNIAAFGGDPRRVTLGGVSAGAAMASLLMTLKSARRPAFAQLLLLSPGSMRPLCSLEEAQWDGLSLASDLPSLREASTDALIDLNRSSRGGPRALLRPRARRPIIDHSLVTDDERAAHVASGVATVPMIVSSVIDEGGRLAEQSGIDDVPSFRRFISDQFGPDAEQACSLYPVRDVSEVRSGLGMLFGDTQFTYGATALAASCARSTNVQRLVFGVQSRGEPRPRHGDDVRFAFGNVPRNVGPGGIGKRRAAASYSQSVAKFVCTGTADWDPCGIDGEPYLAFTHAPKVARGWRSEQLLFLDSRYSKEGSGRGGRLILPARL